MENDMEHALLRGRVEYDMEAKPPAHMIVERALLSTVSALLDDPNAFKATFKRTSGVPLREECEVEIAVVTDKKAKAGIDNRLHEARIEGMKEVLSAIERYRGTAWAGGLGAGYGVECVFEAAIKKIQEAQTA